MINKIIFLLGALHTGDNSHADAISRFLIDSRGKIDIVKIDVDQPPEDYALKFQEETKNDPAGKKNIIYALGMKGSSSLRHLSSKGLLGQEKNYVVLGLHQLTEDFKVLAASVDHIVVPETTIKSRADSLIISRFPNRTLNFAVPTMNLSLDELSNSYDRWDSQDKPDLNDKYIIVMLPGDAIDPKGNMRYFTEDSSQELFNDLNMLWERNGRQHKIIIQNGPRTGKYNSETGEIINSHEYNAGSESVVDHISQGFIDKLENSCMEYKFFNFVTEINGDERKSSSVYNQLLYLAYNDNYFIMPGESISMLGQVPLYVRSDKLIVFKSSSLNESHEAVFNLAVERNYVSYFSSEGEVVMPEEIKKRDKDDLSKTIQDIIQGCEKKFSLGMQIER